MNANPGPIDGSVLYDQDKHDSAAVWDGQVTCSYFQTQTHAPI